MNTESEGPAAGTAASPEVLRVRSPDYHTSPTPHVAEAFAEVAADLHRQARRLLDAGEPAHAARLLYWSNVAAALAEVSP